VLVAQAVFQLQRVQTDKQTNATKRHTHAGGYSGVGNDNYLWLSVFAVPAVAARRVSVM